MSTSAGPRSTVQRLQDSCERVDQLRAQVAPTGNGVRSSVVRSIDELRARDADLRARLRNAVVITESELDVLELDVAIVAARVRAARAENRTAYERAVQDVLNSWSALIEILQQEIGEHGPAVRRRLAAGLISVREGAAAAAQRLRDLRDAPSDAWHHLKPEVEVALDNVDRVARQTRARLQTIQPKGT